MKIKDEVWMLAGIVGSRVILYRGLACHTKRQLMEEACAKFYGGTTWKHIKHSGWRPVKVTIAGSL